jgi:hypothetical protein
LTAQQGYRAKGDRAWTDGQEFTTGGWVAHMYDGLGRETDVRYVKSDGTTQTRYTYTYDLLGNPAQVRQGNAYHTSP